VQGSQALLLRKPWTEQALSLPAVAAHRLGGDGFCGAPREGSPWGACGPGLCVHPTASAARARDAAVAVVAVTAAPCEARDSPVARARLGAAPSLSSAAQAGAWFARVTSWQEKPANPGF